MKDMRKLMASEIKSVDKWVAHSILPPILAKLLPLDSKAGALTLAEDKDCKERHDTIIRHLQLWTCDEREELRIRTRCTFKKLWGEVKFLQVKLPGRRSLLGARAKSFP